MGSGGPEKEDPEDFRKRIMSPNPFPVLEQLNSGEPHELLHNLTFQANKIRSRTCKCCMRIAILSVFFFFFFF